MRKSLGLLIGTLLVLGLAGSASAKTLAWHGTLDIDLGALQTRGIATPGDAHGHQLADRLVTARACGVEAGDPIHDP